MVLFVFMVQVEKSTREWGILKMIHVGQICEKVCAYK